MSQTDWIKEHAKSIKRLATQDPITLEDLTLIWKYANLIEQARAGEVAQDCPLCGEDLGIEQHFHMRCAEEENARDEAWPGSEPNADGQTEVMEMAV